MSDPKIASSCAVIFGEGAMDGDLANAGGDVRSRQEVSDWNPESTLRYNLKHLLSMVSAFFILNFKLNSKSDFKDKEQ